MRLAAAPLLRPLPSPIRPSHTSHALPLQQCLAQHSPLLLLRRLLHETSLVHSRSTRPKTPLPQDAPHASLPTFLAHAQRYRLDPSSKVYQGTVYEYVVARALSRLGFRLARKGGRGDQGVDLLGVWRLPVPSSDDVNTHDGDGRKERERETSDLRVFVQCKALKGKAAPSVARELEGAYAALNDSSPTPSVSSLNSSQSSSNSSPITKNDNDSDQSNDLTEDLYGPSVSQPAQLGLLATPGPATRGVRESLARSRVPLGFAAVTRRGRVRQLVWNAAAARVGGVGSLEVGVRYLPSGPRDEGDVGMEEEGELEQEIVLTRRGELWEFPVED